MPARATPGGSARRGIRDDVEDFRTSFRRRRPPGRGPAARRPDRPGPGRAADARRGVRATAGRPSLAADGRAATRRRPIRRVFRNQACERTVRPRPEHGARVARALAGRGARRPRAPLPAAAPPDTGRLAPLLDFSTDFGRFPDPAPGARVSGALAVSPVDDVTRGGRTCRGRSTDAQYLWCRNLPATISWIRCAR